jgi:hypothetical protein
VPKKGITKKKFCISVDSDIYEALQSECDELDAKISTRINSILKKYLDDRRTKK